MSIELANIPTLTQLYKRGIVQNSSVPLFAPSKLINDRVSIYRGDITKIKTDAIVNAANNALRNGSGVNGAIHDAAGPQLAYECEKLDGCATGDAKLTEAYSLPSKFIIHTVGPIFHNHSPEKSQSLLASCYSRSLQVAKDNDLRSVAFSSISTGIFGYPFHEAAATALLTTRKFFEENPENKIDRVVFVLFSASDEQTYKHLITQYFPN
ncbi:hypothetical protein V1514DRAFT_324522 [Lipomyces japonicus]|uniref:uncharacterized protein n=1 Tax=Lipomyces japonicus TaxID=56871 RepID=UPI0034CD23BA